ncbi:hypothetical protein DL771_002612 [Monosporascus sp. 5C6A]|nr:hypothetical protein DL771_002612 [Monosporascus sp. 5C6A]
MSEEPTLPRLPTVTWNSETQSFNNTRKRARDPADAPPPPQFATSSDPAVFSSDDDPHVENYVHGRHRKKRYVGSWYQQHPASSSDSAFSEEQRPLPKKAQRTFQRQFDSGVWMGSDGFTEDEDTIIEPELSTEPRLPQLRRTPARVTLLSQAEELARLKIEEAIDSGSENIDLSGLNLEELSNETISRLSEFTCIPLVAEDVPFEQRDPALKLYLASNPLPRVPGAIFNLEFLTVLSLRNTQITELPPCIGNLRNLTDLNVSLNRLQYLPGELLDLLQKPRKLTNLTVHPNPFCIPEKIPSPLPQPEAILNEYHPGVKPFHEAVWPNGWIFRAWFDEEDGLKSDPEKSQGQDPERCRWQIRAVARSPVEYSDSRGMVLSQFKLPTRETTRPASDQPSHVIVQTEDLKSTPAPLRDARDQATDSSISAGRVPSLFELALKACSRSGQLRDLPSYLPTHAPPQFARVLNQLVTQGEDNANAGDVPCSVCKRRVMMPTVAWIEWWHVTRTAALPKTSAIVVDALSRDERENFVPFLRRGCGWNCVPRPTEVGQLRPGSVRWSLQRPPSEEEDAESVV